MLRFLAVLVLAGASVNAQTITTQTFGSGASQFSIDFVEIGNPGNAANTDWSHFQNPIGRVEYIYNLGKYEISRDQIEKANAAGGLGLTLGDLTNYGGNWANRPANGISWNEAARFVNYLNTSQGYQAAYNFTATGPNDNITLWGLGQYSGINRYRHKDARYFLPGRNEWYKAAFGSPSGTWNYYAFEESSLSNRPTMVSGGTGANTVVTGSTQFQGPADINNAGGLSPFGTMAQTGNVFEWMENDADPINGWFAKYESETAKREIRGGGWYDGALFWAENTNFSFVAPTSEDTGNVDFASVFGFRVAMVPEPSSLSLLLACGAVALARRRKA